MSMYSNAWAHEKRVEPVKRNKDGVRWIVHRFPIKNGISIRDSWIYDMAHQRNPFLEALRDARS